jgi:hypothetical protein
MARQIVLPKRFCNGFTSNPGNRNAIIFREPSSTLPFSGEPGENRKVHQLLISIDLKIPRHLPLTENSLTYQTVADMIIIAK